MELKSVRILSLLPIILALLTAGCDANLYPNVHMILGILTLVSAVATTISLFILKQ